MAQMNLPTEQKMTARQREQIYPCKGGGGTEGCAGSLQLVWVNNRVLMYSMKVKVTRSVVSTLFDPTDCIPPGSSIRGIFQARVLEWVAISFFRGSSQPRDRTWVSCIADRRFTI